MALQISITITGVDSFQQRVARYRDAATAASRSAVVVGTNVRYAIYQHEGTRFMTGTFYLARGLAAVRPEITPAVAKALPKGGGAVRDALLKLGYKVEAAAKPFVRVRTGNLRRSLHTAEIGARG